MAKINLLPWRAERRKQRQKEFTSMLGLAAVVGALVGFLIIMYYNGQISGQQKRNDLLRQEITAVEAKIKQIKELDKKKDRLLARKAVIEELQATRSQMVHLFDELARTIADGTQIMTIQQNGTKLTMTGRTQSNARVSTYMRNLEASGWITNPELSIIQAKGTDKSMPYEFSLSVTLKNPSKKDDGAVAVEGGGK
jgi:type IV pilus assembly protein PilN